MIKPLRPSENNTTFWKPQLEQRMSKNVEMSKIADKVNRQTVKLALVTEKFKISNKTMKEIKEIEHCPPSHDDDVN